MRSIRYPLFVFLTVFTVVFGFGVARADEVLYSVSAKDALLRTVSPGDGSTLDTIEIERRDGKRVSGARALASSPVTGELWAVLAKRGFLYLAVIDPRNGLAEVVGRVHSRTKGLTFDTDGTLYAVRSGGWTKARCGRCRDCERQRRCCRPRKRRTRGKISVLSTRNGRSTAIVKLSGDLGASSIAFNSGDNLLYVGSGKDLLRAIDRDERKVVEVPVVDGDNLGKIGALVYREEGGEFLWASAKRLSSIREGQASVIGELDHESRGLAFLDFEVKTVPVLTEFVRGDSNCDGLIDMSDAITVLRLLFNGDHDVCCLDAADFDDRGFPSIASVVRLLRYLFDGQPLPIPSPGCGLDPTDDALACDAGALCVGE